VPQGVIDLSAFGEDRGPGFLTDLKPTVHEMTHLASDVIVQNRDRGIEEGTNEVLR